MRLIDADALEDKAKQYSLGYYEEDEWAVPFKEIGEAPTIDAIPIRPQGEWIKVDDVSISCRCSVCGWEAHLYEDDVYGMPYCPNCGARMKGADDGVDDV